MSSSLIFSSSFSVSKSSSSIPNPTSSRTGGPNFLRRSSCSMLASKSSDSSSSSSRSAFRVIRNAYTFEISIPGKSSAIFAVITCSRGMYLRSSPVDVTTNLAKFDGTLTRAKSSTPVSGFLTITARLSDSPEIYGKGCEGSIANGVKTGNICLWKISVASSRS